MTPENRQLLADGIAEIGLSAEPKILAALAAVHDRLLQTTAEGLNLTGIRDERESVIRNLLDSLAPWKHIAGTPEAAERLKIAEVGAGGGMPGFPLAIVMPFAVAYLIESKAKKAKYLSETADLVKTMLPERRIVVLNADANAVPVRCDRVVFRAFGPLDKIVRIFDRVVAPHGKGIAYKGTRDRIDAELAALTESQRERCRVVAVTVPFLPADEQRHAVIIAAPEKAK